MKKLAVWLLVITAVATAASMAIGRYQPASSALKSFIRPGRLSTGHAYLAERCESCHVTNVGVTVAKCTYCHANDERLLGRQPSAFHAGIGECGTCHVEHQGASANPIRMDHLELARVGARTLARASRTDDASAATLKSLETWLRIRVPGQLDENSAAAALNCVGCHAIHIVLPTLRSWPVCETRIIAFARSCMNQWRTRCFRIRNRVGGQNLAERCGQNDEEL